jgi:hypothetical protein
MTVAQALALIRRVGTVAKAGGKLKLAFPEQMRADLQPAVDVLKAGKAEALAHVAQLQSEKLARAGAVLRNAGVRIMPLQDGTTIGIWSDFDGPEVRAALRTFGSERLPVRYLDGAGVPIRYKVRWVEGEPVPPNVLAEMEQHSAEPWEVRDRMLNAMGWRPEGIPWAEWKAATLTRLFLEQGATGQPGRITASTIRRGESPLGEAARVCSGAEMEKCEHERVLAGTEPAGRNGTDRNGDDLGEAPTIG